MRRIISFFLSAVLLLSLSACAGRTGAVDKNSTDTYVGDWAYDTGQGNIITYHFIKGGSGYYEQTSTGDTRWEFAWEVKDSVVTTTRNAIGASFLTTFEVDDSGTSLVCISGNIDEGPYWKQES